MRSALRRASFSVLPPQLEYAEDPFWVAVREALDEIAEETLTAT